MSSISARAPALLERLVGTRFAVPLRHLWGGSWRAFLGRLGRLRRLAAGMVEATASPALPVRLQIETTDICNLECTMCTREVLTGMDSTTLSLEKFEELLDEIDPYYVTLNGLGEPLIDATIFEKLAALHARGIRTAMPTNGTRISGERAALLAENHPDILTFSIDGATARSFEAIRKKGRFERILANYAGFLDVRRGGARPGTRVQVLCALQKDNLHDYGEMYRLLQELDGVDEFALVPVFDYDAGGGRFDPLIPTRLDVLELDAAVTAAIAETNDPKEIAFYERWRDVASTWLEGSRSPFTGACLVPWFNTYIDAKGRVYPCCFLTGTGHVMGNVSSEPFREVWRGAPYAAFREALTTDREHLEGCRTCPRNDSLRLADLRRLRPLLGRSGS
jgi:radical SAM protein with 4Fe4S-binding SPASM domain